MTKKVTMTFVVGLTKLMIQEGHRVIRGLWAYFITLKVTMTFVVGLT